MRQYYCTVAIAILGVILHYCTARIGTLLKENEYFKRGNNIFQECVTQHSANEIDMIKALIFPGQYKTDGHECVWACFFKRMDVVDDKGMYDQNVVIENLTKSIDSENERKEVLTIAKNCVSVNKQSVSDGAAGCDRSMLLAKCIANNVLENQTKFSLRRSRR